MHLRTHSMRPGADRAPANPTGPAYQTLCTYSIYRTGNQQQSKTQQAPQSGEQCCVTHKSLLTCRATAESLNKHSTGHNQSTQPRNATCSDPDIPLGNAAPRCYDRLLRPQHHSLSPPTTHCARLRAHCGHDHTTTAAAYMQRPFAQIASVQS